MVYKFFFTNFCPNCPAVKNKITNLNLSGQLIDAGTLDGLEEARIHNVQHVPTAIFFDGDKEIGRAHTVGDLEKISAKYVIHATSFVIPSEA